MKIIIHRGTHQIGGIATEIRTDKTRILIDMGDELSLDPDFVSSPLHIPGVTDTAGHCDGVLFTHYHGDHTGQMNRIHEDIPLYAGVLCKEIMRLSDERMKGNLGERITTIRTFEGGDCFTIGDITITAYAIDHSAGDSYMFLIEADGKRILHTGDFRLHGFRRNAMPKILDKLIRKVDVLITEGTTITRVENTPPSEQELQVRLKDYISKYKYVFVLAATTNLDRVFSCSHAVPTGKYFICDDYQAALLKATQAHLGKYTNFYCIPKLTTYSDNLLAKFKELGFVMMVRDNRDFRRIISHFDAGQSIILYSMWDGYRTKPGSKIPEFLALTGTWEAWHTSGHASAADIKTVIEKSNPDIVIPVHTEAPELMQSLCPNRKVVLLSDGEAYIV